MDYTLSHFAFEETLMEDAGYQFSRAHKKIHELFIRRVSEYRVRFQAGEDVGDELKGLLSRWLFNHIRNDDAGYVDAVRHSMSELVRTRAGRLVVALDEALLRLIAGEKRKTGPEGPVLSPADLASADQAEEFAAGGCVVAEFAEHHRSDHGRVLLFHAAHHHAHVLGLDHHRDAGAPVTCWTASAICRLMFSWICRRRAYMSTIRATFDRPSTLPFGI